MSDISRPTSYATLANTIELGFSTASGYTTSHGIKTYATTNPVCGHDGEELSAVLYGHRDGFSTNVLQDVREAQALAHEVYMREGRSASEAARLPEHVAYVVSYHGQVLGYATRGRTVHMNDPMERANQRAFRVVREALERLVLASGRVAATYHFVSN